MDAMHGKRLVMPLGLAALSAAIFILNEIAAVNHLYWVYWWYDIMMHFLGGFLIGGLSAWGARRFDETMTFSRVVVVVLVAVALVGVGWEVFEYLTGQYAGQPGIVADTILDLVMDVLGALFAVVLFRRILPRPSTAEHPAEPTP